MFSCPLISFALGFCTVLAAAQMSFTGAGTAAASAPAPKPCAQGSPYASAIFCNTR